MRTALSDQELSFAFGDRVHFLCLSKENRTKRNDTPRSRPLRGFVSRSRGFRQFIPELAKTRVRPARAPKGPDRLRLTTNEGTRKASQCAASSLLGPVGAPSSGGSGRGKARLFEAMYGRVRAVRRVPSNAGNGGSFIATTRTSGRLSFGDFSLPKQRKDTRWSEGTVKALVSNNEQTLRPESCHTSPMTSGTTESPFQPPSCRPISHKWPGRSQGRKICALFPLPGQTPDADRF